jgi:hypothetical protein
MKIKHIIISTAANAIVVAGITFAFSGSGNPTNAHQGRPDLATIFNGNYHQEVERFGNVSRTAYDASGQVIGTQIGTYRRGEPSGMTIEMTYLEPDAEHPRGQAFDGAGKPMPLH